MSGENDNESVVSDRSVSYAAAMPKVRPDPAPEAPSGEKVFFEAQGDETPSSPVARRSLAEIQRLEENPAGPTMTFEDIRFEVFPASTMTFIMGPSGAGKTTLLDALAGRINGGNMSGISKVNGCVLKPWQFRMVSKYVQQHDVLVPVLTTRETLYYSALFYTTDKAEANKRANDALKILGLEKSASTWVGNAIIRGLSGGQRRRLSVGVELVAKPKLLFLDEPTSGLDSTSAYAVVEALTRITRTEGTTMALTIHQPAEMLMKKSDRVIVLASGKTAYAGPSNAAVEYMQGLGYKIPEFTSTSEFLLDLVNADFSDETTVKTILGAWDGTEQANANLKLIDKVNGARGEQTICSTDIIPTKHYMTPPFHEFKVLAQRTFLNTLRNPLVIWLRMALYVMLSVMIGTVWLRIADGNPGSDVVQDVASALFFIAAFMVFMSVAVQIAYVEEKAIFSKERAAGMYSTLPYTAAHLVVDAPFLLFLSLVCSIICYYSLGLNGEEGRFGFFVVDLFLSLLVAESLMLVIAAVSPVAIVGIAAGAMIYGGFMMVQGFFVKLDQIGWWWRWMHFIGMHTYSFAGFMKNEFEGRTFPAGEQNGVPTAPITGEQVIQSYDFIDIDKWEDMAVLVAMVVFYRLFAAYIMSRG